MSILPLSFPQRHRNRSGRIDYRAGILSIVGLLWLALVSTPVLAEAGNVLKEIRYATLPGNGVRITLEAAQAVAEPRVFTTDNPARIALDFDGMSSGLEQKTQAIDVGMTRSVTAVEAGGRTRVIINLAGQTPHDLEVAGNTVIVTLAGSGAAAAAPRATMGSAVDRPTPSRAAGGRTVENVDFRRGPAGEGRILIEMSDASPVVDMRQEGARIVLDIMKTALPERFMRKFDVADFATPVQLVEVSARGDNVHIVVTPSGEYEHLAYQADRLFTLEVKPVSKEEKEEMARKRKTFTGERLSLNFQDIEVRAVLQLLADFTGLNLVTSDTVGGRITLRLKNVPWDQALDLILKTRGLSMRQTDNVVLIAPTEEITARERLELESQQQVEELAPLLADFVQINYAKAADIAGILKNQDNRLLSERGQVTVDERTNTLLLRDTAAKLEDIRQLLTKLDVPVRQVLIESRIVQADDNFTKDLGVRWGFARENKIGDDTYLGISGGLEDGLMVSLPAAGAVGGINLAIAKIGSYILDLELTAMQNEGKGEIISSPRVVTSDKSKAVIKQGYEIPYQEATSSGATSASFKEAVLSLEATPFITPDDRVILDLIVTKDAPDFENAVGQSAEPPITTNSVETSVLVDNGETVVLGGVYETDRSQRNSKVPFFGDLPYVGFAFKNEYQQMLNKELLIFVTPKILKEELSLR